MRLLIFPSKIWAKKVCIIQGKIQYIWMPVRFLSGDVMLIMTPEVWRSGVFLLPFAA